MREVTMFGRILVLFIPVVLLCPGSRSHAQITGDLVILSERVGEYVDLKERDYYHVFGNVTGFRGARVIAESDTLMYVVFDVHDANGPSVMQRRYPLTLLQIMAEKIEHFEEIEDGHYVMGTTPVKLKTVKGRPITIKPAPSVSGRTTHGPAPGDILFFAGQVVQRPPEYPMFKFAGGVSDYHADLSGLNPLFAAIEDFYRGTGYAIRQHTLTDERSTTTVLGFSVSLAFSRRLEVALEVARRKGILEMDLAGLTVRYMPAFLDLDFIRAYALAGLFTGYFEIASDVQYGNQIGPADNLGRYQMFYGIQIKGQERRMVPAIGGGIELGDPSVFPLGIDLFVRYLLAPQITVSSQHGSGSVKTSALTLGVSLVLYFEGRRNP
jgi:hypothetical protein